MSDKSPAKPVLSLIEREKNRDPMIRLPSLKPPRDLTLGAGKANKKVFTPNLNVSRNKNKGASTSDSQGSNTDEGQRKGRKAEKNKKSRGSNIIKTSGVFSEGMASVDLPSAHSSYSREEASSPPVQKHAMKFKSASKIAKELDALKIRSGVAEASAVKERPYVDVMGVDFSKATERDAPVKLPMDERLSNPVPTVKLKEEVIVKAEPDAVRTSRKEETADVKSEPGEMSDVASLLNRKDSNMFLLQLPDTLPGLGGLMADEPTSGDMAKPSTSTAKNDKPGDSRCTLSDVNDGRIGTLRTHRSGRVTLLLGETVFDVTMGTPPAFYQEVVSVTTNEATGTAMAISLGALEHKLIVVPQFEEMFEDASK